MTDETEVTKTDIEIFTASKLEQIASKGEIKSNVDYGWMLAVQRECAQQINSVEDAMGSHIKNAFQAHRALLATKNKTIDPILAVKKVTAKLMGAWDAKCALVDEAKRKLAEQEARKLLQEQAKVDAANLAEAGKLDAAKSALQHAKTMPAPVVEIPSSRPRRAGTLTKTTYSVEIVTVTQVLRKYMIPDMKLLNEMARTQKDDYDVRGTRLIKETKTHARG